MLTINIESEDIRFKDITKENLDDVLRLYNQNQNNKYATGIDRRMSKKDVNEKYLEVLVNSHEFFVGIFERDPQLKNILGVIKGRIDYENSEEAWISSILIDFEHQKQGLGSKSVDMIIKTLNRHYDIKRVFAGIISANKVGMVFWQKLGFDYMRTIEQYIQLNKHYEDLIIMKKDL